MTSALPTAPSSPSKATGYDLFQKVAINSCVEICAIAVITRLCFHYAETDELKAQFLRKAVVVVGINILARSIAAVSRCYRPFSRIADYIAPICFALKFHRYTTCSLIHEMGHALVIFLFARNDQVQIAARSLGFWETTPIFKEVADMTAFCASPLLLIYKAAGAAATLLTAQAALILGLRMQKAYPEFSKYLIFSATVSIFVDAVYALQSLLVEKESDFSVLWKGFGIHPAVAAITIVALPILGTIAYLYTESKEETPSL